MVRFVSGSVLQRTVWTRHADQMSTTETTTNDHETLRALNDQFIEAFRIGSWSTLEPVLAAGFRYLDGASGEVWEMPRYIESVGAHPDAQLRIDQVVIHLDGDVAVVSARSIRSDRSSRYVDSYHRREGRWLCYHACVWPLD